MHGAVTNQSDASSLLSLSSLGWSAFFENQRAPGDGDAAPRRIAEVHRARLTAMSETGTARLVLPPNTNTGDYAVGDWVLADPRTAALHRRLTRRTVLERHTEGGRGPQLAAANVDTLFIVTSCNADFNPARLERYLALANQGGATPVILLTKGDATADVASYREQAAALQRDLTVLALDPRSPEAVSILAPWCGTGLTVALVGSSGVGKSTLVNTLAGPDQTLPQLTGAIREHDAKGRHTTTARSLHAIAGGGWVIDTPGMRTLHVGEAAGGIETLFAEIMELAPLCRFSDCSHRHEPGCAVQAAVQAGTLDAERVARWRTLSEEDRANTPTFAGPRGNRTLVGRPRKR